MRSRYVWVLGFVSVVAAITGITAIADPIGLLDEPVVYTWSDCGPSHQPHLYEAWVWEDGSAEFKIAPKIALSADKVASQGVITVNGQTFQMAPRRDAAGSRWLFGSVPVGTFYWGENLGYSVQAYDADGTPVGGSEGYFDFEEE